MGELKGKLIESFKKPSEVSNLKGTLIKNKIEDDVEFSEEWLKNKILVMRDSKERYRIESIGISDISKKKVVKLVCLDKEKSATKEFLSLIDNLKTSGSPWSIEK